MHHEAIALTKEGSWHVHWAATQRLADGARRCGLLVTVELVDLLVVKLDARLVVELGALLVVQLGALDVVELDARLVVELGPRLVVELVVVVFTVESVVRLVDDALLICVVVALGEDGLDHVQVPARP